MHDLESTIERGNQMGCSGPCYEFIMFGQRVLHISGQSDILRVLNTQISKLLAMVNTTKVT